MFHNDNRSLTKPSQREGCFIVFIPYFEIQLLSNILPFGRAWVGLFNVLSNLSQIVLHSVCILMVDDVKEFLELIADF